MRVLVVDDTPAVRTSLRRALTHEGYDVFVSPDGADALRVIADEAPDLVILDGLMPRLDGIEVCRTLRLSGDTTPVLLLTVRRGVADRVAGLDAGADDYLVKPFALEELLARARALMRRAGAEDATGPLVYDGIRVEPASRRAWYQERLLELTLTEFDLLAFLTANPERVHNRQTIMYRVWGFDLGASSNTLAVYIGYLRRKLEATGAPPLIHTVRGMGYVLRAP